MFEGVPQFRIARTELGLPFVDLCAEKTQVFPRRANAARWCRAAPRVAWNTASS